MTVNGTQVTVTVMLEVRLVSMGCSYRVDRRQDNGCDGPVPFGDCERYR